MEPKQRRKPADRSDNERRLGHLLAVARAKTRVTQKEVADRIGVSVSLLTKVERGIARGAFSRAQVRSLAEIFKFVPPEWDELFEAAGYVADRTPDEEAFIHTRVPGLKTVWIYTEAGLMPGLYQAIASNLSKGVHYRFFTASAGFFDFLLEWLVPHYLAAEAHPLPNSFDLSRQWAEALRQRVECVVLPLQIFAGTFIVYNPQDSDCFASVAKDTRDGPDFYFTRHNADIYLRLRWLGQFVSCIEHGTPILLPAACKVFPPTTPIPTAEFGSRETSAPTDQAGKDGLTRLIESEMAKLTDSKTPPETDS